MRYLLIAVIFLSALNIAGCNRLPQYPDPLIKDNRVVINTLELKEKSPEFYTVNINGSKANFFVLKISGKIESYFDACVRCFKDKKGYSTKNRSIVCRSCGVTYPLDMLRDGFGSCHPIQLQGEIRGNQYIISLDEIEKGTKLF